MTRHDAREILNNPSATREDIHRAVYSLDMEIRYIYESRKQNPAQDSSNDIRENLDLIALLEARLDALA